MGKAKTASSSFRVGDRVRVPFGARKVEARIVEDRGSIGFRGRHLFVVEVPMDPSAPLSFELPESEIEAASVSTGNGAEALTKAKIIEFMKGGGLLAILRQNISGGHNQPRIWLRYDTHGNITYTFTKDRGVIGGEIVPFWALHGERIFTAKADEVRTFLGSFGLKRIEADDVIASVGTAP